VPRLSRRSLLAGSLAPATVGFVACTHPSSRRQHPRSETAVFGGQFRFGVSTSAYQIEGSIKADGRGGSVWDTCCGQPGKIDDASSGEVACDHYRRWETDLDLLHQLGIESYRFSIAGRGCCDRPRLGESQRIGLLQATPGLRGPVRRLRRRAVRRTRWRPDLADPSMSPRSSCSRATSWDGWRLGFRQRGGPIWSAAWRRRSGRMT
jgi:hypothetical protein